MVFDYTLEDAINMVIQLTDRGKNTVELSIFNPEAYTDTWMHVQSESKTNVNGIIS